MMRAACLLFIAFTSLVMSLPARAIDIPAIADAYSDSQMAQTNFGSNGVVAISRSRTTFIRFDSAALARTPGTEAMLNLSLLQVKNWQNAVEIHLVKGPWNERTLTAANAPPISATVLAAKTVGDIDQGRTISFNISAALDAWRNDPAQNFGIAIVASNPLPNLQFLSRELRGGATLTLRSDPVLAIVDIRPIVARHDVGNAGGLAFNADADVLYLSHGSDDRGFIYTLDLRGDLLQELDFTSAYRPGAIPLSLTYDRTSRHLFVHTTFSDDDVTFEEHLLEMDPRTAHIFSDVRIPDLGGGGGIHVRRDGIWQARFAEDVIRHYSRKVKRIEDLSVAASFPGFPGPGALTSSFAGGGFFLADLFNARLLEIDRSGRELAAVSTASLGSGSGLAIDSDSATERIFLQINNEDIYVLSSEFVRRSRSH